MTAPAPGQGAAADVLASLPRQWDAEADATAHWGDVAPPERAAYANALRDCASELREALAAREPRPSPELAAAMAETRHYRERLADLRGRVLAVADELEAAANSTHPSKKSETERAAARRLRKALDL